MLLCMIFFAGENQAMIAISVIRKRILNVWKWVLRQMLKYWTKFRKPSLLNECATRVWQQLTHLFIENQAHRFIHSNMRQRPNQMKHQYN